MATYCLRAIDSGSKCPALVQLPAPSCMGIKKRKQRLHLVALNKEKP